MSSTRRRTATAGLLVLAALVSTAALAWACTPQASIGISTASGPPGTQVTVSGSDFFPGGPVTITWNGGQVLATATGPSFSVTVTIPNAPAETHTIVAVGREQNGSAVGRARQSFTIPGVAPSPGGGSGEGPKGTDRSAPGSSSGSASGGNGVSADNGATADGGERVVSGGSEGVAAGDRDGPASDTRLADSSSVFADSTVESQGRGDAAVSARRGGSAASPSERSAAAGLWGGFANGRAPSLSTAAGPTEDSSLPGIVWALIGLGLVSVTAGAGVAATRRRRAAAGSSD